jgi:pilus assembly protein Flp/PilA
MIRQLVQAFNSLVIREEGQTLVEYALILVMVSIAVIALLASLGAYSPAVFSHINSDL